MQVKLAVYQTAGHIISLCNHLHNAIGSKIVSGCGCILGGGLFKLLKCYHVTANAFT